MTPMKLTTGAALCAVALALPVGAAAQTSDQWQFGLTLYGYFPDVSGTSKFPPSGSTPSIDVKVDDLLDLKFAFMGTFEARKGRWGAFTDFMYLDVGDSKSDARDFAIGGAPIPGTASVDVDYDLKGLVWTIAGEYNVVSNPSSTVDVFAGARLVDLDQDVRWNVTGNIGTIPLPGRSGSSNVSRSNWDGIIGVKGRLRFGAENRWFVPYYLDVGTGQSDFTWQAMAGLGYSWGWGDILAAWRYLDYDMGEGKPFTDLSLNGPAVAVVFRW